MMNKGGFMSFFARGNEVARAEAEEMRRVLDEHLAQCSDLQLVMLGLAVMMEAVGVEDDALIAELRRRVSPETQKPGS